MRKLLVHLKKLFISQFKNDEKNYSGSDLEKAAAIDNDETMIINDDLSIITTPIESPHDMVGSSKKSPHKKQIDSDETLTSDTSTSEAATLQQSKRHRPKARSESNRSEKYAKEFLFCFYCYPIGCFFIHIVLHFSKFFHIYVHYVITLNHS